MANAYLVLADGHVFEGEPLGAPCERTVVPERTAVSAPGGLRGAKPPLTGEVVFTTGMTGYLETLTDPSYVGQIVVQTFPMIGNYGVIPEDFESGGITPSGYVVRECSGSPSNFRSRGGLDSLLKERGVVGLCGVDTRAITRVIRERGVMNGAITADVGGIDALLEEIRDFRIVDSVAAASAKGVSVASPAGAPRHRVVLWDFGAKESIARQLLARGCEVVRVPHDCTAEQILEYAPDGIMLSNGPGDPAENLGIIAELRKLAESGVPIFGICLGHQLLALAMGGRTAKLKYGHRGANQPVRDALTGRVYITTQNHGYMVDADSLGGMGILRYVNANDGTCEGVDYTAIPAFTVQFHPEAAAGPHDAEFLFERFMALMDGGEA